MLILMVKENNLCMYFFRGLGGNILNPHAISFITKTLRHTGKYNLCIVQSDYIYIKIKIKTIKSFSQKCRNC